ncbi:MAG: TRAP transporter large permease subunit, partial [bacterium]|nr:TRAP transporter large permease subunit [bacterium]
MSKRNIAIQKLVPFFQKVENMAAFAAVVLLALIPFMEVILRKFFHTGFPYSSEYIHHLVLVLTFIAGMITSREKKHLSISLGLKIEEPMKSWVHTGLMLLSAMMTTAFFWSAISFVLNGFDPSQKIGIFPIRLVGAVMVVGYGVIAGRFVAAVPKGGPQRLIAGTGILLGTVLALEPLSQTLATVLGSEAGFLETMLQAGHSVNAAVAVPLIILLLIAALLGAPIFVVMGGIAFLLFARMGEPLMVIPNEAYAMLISHSIPAIPLFTVAGFILSESKAGERLVRFFKAFFAWFPGGLAVMAILVSSFFTTFTGASGVTILALGALLSYALIKGKYKRRFSLGLLTSSGSIGLLFPPSLPIILYGVIAGISIKDMFLGGIVPGIVMILALV